MQHYLTTNIFNSNPVQNLVSSNIQLDPVAAMSIQVISGAADVTGRAFASSGVSTSNDTITSTAHGLLTGVAFQLTTTGTLPTGLAAATTYYAIVADADTLKVATSLANALAGTKIDITGAGSGNSTITPLGISAQLKFQVSNVSDPSASASSTDWCDKGSVITFDSNTASSSMAELQLKDTAYKNLRAVYTHTAGYYALQVILNAKQ